MGGLGTGLVVWFSLGLVAYFFALATAVAGLLIASWSLRTVRAQRIGLVVTSAALVAAVAVPWRLAALERSGDPVWTTRTEGAATIMYSTGEHAVYADDRGIHAVGLHDGETVWSHEASGIVGAFDVAADGHVLARVKDSGSTSEALWISPEGEILWRHSAAGGSGSDLSVDEYAFNYPIASSDGTLVVTTCEDRKEPTSCRYLGIDRDGSEKWSIDGEDKTSARGIYSQPTFGFKNPREIPEIALVEHASNRNGESTSIVDVTDGRTLGTADVGEDRAVLGDIVVYEVGPAAENGLCETGGLSADGEVSWTRDTPCLSAGAIVLGPWIYGSLEGAHDPVDATPGEEVFDSYALDPSTGRWQPIGPLAVLNVDADSRSGAAGTEVVVQRQDQHLTQVDPASGESGWTLDVPGAAIPGVEAANGAAAVLYQPEAGHNPFGAGKDRTRDTGVLAVDTRSGRVTGSLTSQVAVRGALPVSAGQVLVSQEGKLSLIGAQPN